MIKFKSKYKNLVVSIQRDDGSFLVVQFMNNEAMVNEKDAELLSKMSPEYLWCEEEDEPKKRGRPKKSEDNDELTGTGL